MKYLKCQTKLPENSKVMIYMLAVCWLLPKSIATDSGMSEEATS
jgi:hypothetical protein